MPVYEYRCGECGNRVSRWIAMSDDAQRALWNQKGQPCPRCQQNGRDGRLRRIWGFSQAAVMHEHWNPTVNKPVSSMRQFKDELKRASDVQTAKTGIEHRYVPVDPREMAPPDDSGQKEQYDKAVKDGRIETNKKVL